MTFQDIFKKSFLEGWANTTVSTGEVVLSLVFSLVLACYIFFVYRMFTKQTFYSRSFNISLAGVTVITAAIIITIHSSIMVSLGMVGALSIVRFRTAIKDPVDLMFLFWAISTGIICGAGHTQYAVILSVLLTVGVFVLDRIPDAKAPMLLVINASDIDVEDKVSTVIDRYSDSFTVKARNMSEAGVNLTIELRTKDGTDMMKSLIKLAGVETASLLEHDGEAVF